MLGPDFQLQLSNLQVPILLQLPELKDYLFILLALMPQLVFKLSNLPLLLIFPIGQVLDFALVHISYVLFGKTKFFSLTTLQIFDFVCVLVIEFVFDLVVGGQDAVHVLLSLLFGFE